MTSLIDVIFLLLMFFMLSTSFTRFAETPLTAAQAGTGLSTKPPRLLQIAADGLTLNGKNIGPDGLAAALTGTDGPVLVALRTGVSAQRLTDILDLLQQVDGLDVTVIE